MNLTERELDVLACIIIGNQSYRSTSEILKIHKSTVSSHIRKILEKTKCETALDLRNYLKIGDLENRYKGLTREPLISLKKNELTYLLISALFLLMLCLAAKLFK